MEKKTRDPKEPAQEQENIKVQQQTAQEVEKLSNRLVATADQIRQQSEMDSFRQSIGELNEAIYALRFATESRLVTQSRTEPAVKPRDCGCGEPPVPKCCVQLYISRLRVISAQGAVSTDANVLELIIAVKALDQCGLYPGLTSFVAVDKDGGWLQIFAPIGKFCVPCNGTLAVPITVEVLETAGETGGVGELKNEFGAASSSISLNCNCEIPPILVDVTLTGGGTGGVAAKKGVVAIEISARRIEGGCC